jgi:hypothetical protein
LGFSNPDFDAFSSSTRWHNRLHCGALRFKQGSNSTSSIYSESGIGATGTSPGPGYTAADGSTSEQAMIKAVMLAVLLWLPQAQVAPINTSAVAIGCTSRTTCTYVDQNVPPGPHFYFAVASNAYGYSGPSNRVDVVVPAGTHSVTLNWDPESDPSVGYFIYRGAPPTNLGVTGVQ